MGVATSGENELAPSCYPAGEPVKKREGEEEARLPRVTFRFHTGGRHLVGVAESDFTVDNLASDYHSAPAGTLFSGVVEIIEFKYGDGPNYYGLRVHSRGVGYVIDTSGSMASRIRVDPEWLAKNQRRYPPEGAAMCVSNLQRKV